MTASVSRTKSALTFFNHHEKNNYKLSLLLSGIYLLSVTVFAVVYLGFQIPICNTTINRVDYFIRDTNCHCTNSLGSNLGIWTQIIMNTTFYKQFDKIAPQMLVTSPIVQTVGVSINATHHIYIANKSFQPFFINYPPYLFANKLTNYTFDLFAFDDPLGLGSEIPASQNYMKNNSCALSYSWVSGVTTYQDPAVCLEKVREYKEDFEPKLTLSYDIPLLQKFCELDYCEVQFCPIDSIVEMVFFCIAIASAIFTFFKIVYHFLMYLYHERKEPMIVHSTYDSSRSFQMDPIS